jgi:hypothetical protein
VRDESLAVVASPLCAVGSLITATISGMNCAPMFASSPALCRVYRSRESHIRTGGWDLRRWATVGECGAADAWGRGWTMTQDHWFSDVWPRFVRIPFWFGLISAVDRQSVGGVWFSSHKIRMVRSQLDDYPGLPLGDGRDIIPAVVARSNDRDPPIPFRLCGYSKEPSGF